MPALSFVGAAIAHSAWEWRAVLAKVGDADASEVVLTKRYPAPDQSVAWPGWQSGTGTATMRRHTSDPVAILP